MSVTGADSRLREHICSQIEWGSLTALGVAVSGGGDSIALLHLLADCARETGVRLAAATVDHGLRAAAAEEAAFVADTCQSLGIAHETMRWQGWDGRGNLQAEARAARYRLLAGWAIRSGLDRVALAHTADDQAETFLMRLSREAGVDGLAAMEAEFSRHGARFCRPVLGLARQDLRDYLSRRGLTWCEDPSNEDEAFDRVKARRVLELLEPLGTGRNTLNHVAHNLAGASRALKHCTQDVARRIAQVEAGDVLFSRAGFLAVEPEIARRLLARALVWVSSADYPPRREALAGLDRAIRTGRPHTLHGCLVTSDRDSIRFAREFNAVEQVAAPLGTLWDRRWRVFGPDAPGRDIRALGEAVKDCPDWRATGLPRASLMASPAIWQGERLIAAPLAGFFNGYSAVIDPSRRDFVASILSH